MKWTIFIGRELFYLFTLKVSFLLWHCFFLSFFYSFVSIHFCNYFSHWNHKIQRNMCGLLLNYLNIYSSCNGEYEMQFTFSFFYLFFHVWFSTLLFPGRWHNTYHNIPCPKRKTKQLLHSTHHICIISPDLLCVPVQKFLKFVFHLQAASGFTQLLDGDHSKWIFGISN